ncbi:hypothetical protein ACGF4C_19990 [Streptomyces sp. NPDC048197]|uniref:hypothetical protein n=1 Tax=Streptomyces sp. NPDC048197 TaxID=3365511 RepID=UPI00371B3DFC
MKFEARRAAAALGRELGHPLTVQSILAAHGAPVGGRWQRGKLDVDQVLVVEARLLVRRLRSRPQVLGSAEVARIAAAAEHALRAAR